MAADQHALSITSQLRRDHAGAFEGGNRTDVLEYAIQGSALERYELMGDFGPFEDWSQPNIL